MSAADDLIERLEKETGQRIDDPDSFALAGLLGALSRMMGQSPPAYTARDDVAAGILIREQLDPEYEKRKRAKEMLALMLLMGE